MVHAMPGMLLEDRSKEGAPTLVSVQRAIHGCTSYCISHVLMTSRRFPICWKIAQSNGVRHRLQRDLGARAPLGGRPYPERHACCNTPVLGRSST